MRPLTVFAPGSFAPVQADLRRAFACAVPGAEVAFGPAAFSGVLARRILDGAPADVFVSASAGYVADLHRAGLISDPKVLAGNRLCLAVRPDLDPPLAGPRDLARPGLRVVLPPAATDPLGAYAAELLRRLGIEREIAEKRVCGEILAGPRAVADLFASGAADAAVLYRSWARAMGAAARTVDLPPELDLRERIAFAVGAVRRDGREHPAAVPFVAFLVGAGQAILARADFLRHPDAGRWPG